MDVAPLPRLANDRERPGALLPMLQSEPKIDKNPLTQSLGQCRSRALNRLRYILTSEEACLFYDNQNFLRILQYIDDLCTASFDTARYTFTTEASIRRIRVHPFYALNVIKTLHHSDYCKSPNVSHVAFHPLPTRVTICQCMSAV